MFTIGTAGLMIRIENRYDEVQRICHEYIVPDTEQPDITVKIKEAELRREIERSPGLFFSNGHAESIVLYNLISDRLPEFDAFVMHSSAISVDGQVYAFAAESGVGKSTHTRYWGEILGKRMTVINGDKPIYRFSPVGKLIAYGTPWNGKENWGEKTCAPVKAICLLERGAENEIFPIKTPSFSDLKPHFHITDSHSLDLPKLIRLMDRMLNLVPVYRLRCRNDISAAELAIGTLIPEKNSLQNTFEPENQHADTEGDKINENQKRF